MWFVLLVLIVFSFGIWNHALQTLNLTFFLLYYMYIYMIWFSSFFLTFKSILHVNYTLFYITRQRKEDWNTPVHFFFSISQIWTIISSSGGDLANGELHNVFQRPFICQCFDSGKRYGYQHLKLIIVCWTSLFILKCNNYCSKITFM